MSDPVQESGRQRIARMIGRRKGPLIASAFLSIAGALFGLAPYLIVYLVATELFLSRHPDRARLLMLAAWAVAAVVAKIVFKALANAVSHNAAYRILADLRVALADRLALMPLGRVRARSSGHIKKVLQDDVEQLELGLSHAIPDIAAAIAVPVASIIAMFVMSWRAGLAAVALVILAVAMVAWAVSRSSGFAEKESSIKADLNTTVVTYLRGMRVLRGFLAGHMGHAATDTAIGATLDVENLKEDRGKWQAVAGTALVSNPLLLILPVGLWCTAQGIVSPATLVFFLLVGSGFAQPLSGLLISMAVLQYQVEAGLRNIAEILDEPDLPVPDEARQPAGFAVELCGVHFRYGEDGPDVLNGVSLQIPERSSLALVGPSGGGKSTLLGLLARFHDVTEGSVRLGGVDLRDMDPVELMRRVAYVQQDDYLFADTLMENIRMARPDATDDEVIAAADRARVSEFVDELPEGWATVLPAGGGRLSGGQRQRISVARALLKGAQIVLLDEATAFLDTESEFAVNAALGELRADATVITVAHRLGTIAGHDRIAYVQDGGILHCDGHDAMLRDCPEYAQLWSDYLDAQGWKLTGGSESAASSTRAEAAARPPRIAEDVRSRELAEELGETPRVRGLGSMNPVRQWLAMVGHQRRDLWRGGLWLIIAEGMLTSAPVVVVVLALLDVFGGAPSAGAWWRYGLALLSIFLVRWGVGVGLASTWWRKANRSLMQLRRSVLGHLRRIPLGEYDRLDVGRTATLVVSDLSLIDFINLPGKIIVGLLQPLLAAVVLFVFDWRLALAALLGVPVFWLLLWVSDGAEKKVLGRVMRMRSRASSDLLEFVQGTAVIRANPDAPQASRYRDTVEELRRSSVAMAVRTSPLTSAASGVLELGFAMLIWVVCLRHLDAGLPQSVALLMLVVSLSLYRPYQELLELSSYRHLQSRIARQVGELWDLEPLPEGELDGPAQAGNGVTVELRDVAFSYRGRRRVLDHASMTARPDQVTALVGPSGSGKSTVANLVARFWDVDEGAVLLAGTDVRDLSPAGLAGQVTTVYQDVYLFPATVRENLTMGADIGDDELWRVLELAQARDFVEAMPDGLDAMVDEAGGNLSGGQRQRLSIARALVKDAPVLLLDEAVASVDPRTEVRIQRALSSLVSGRTVMVIAHRLNTISACENIVVLGDRGIESAGSHEELLTASPTYQRLWAVHERAAASSGPP
ncbi:ABC transporter ATP-binding protein [Propionibacterium australiense]|nr:ABC transporter ATP-binding protein [Propionibacterium australiense]SYZ34591.1 AAA+ ATPase domain [Propionibacterium australiense]VEH92140.1 Probable multidrug resistance ABC transporter ATP-binding/permease protein YheH [Propionibacterium australiense]